MLDKSICRIIALLMVGVAVTAYTWV
jgi:hypothetical protein